MFYATIFKGGNHPQPDASNPEDVYELLSIHSIYKYAQELLAQPDVNSDEFRMFLWCDKPPWRESPDYLLKLNARGCLTLYPQY